MTYPCLYQVNTRVFLTELSGKLGRPVTLDDVPDAELDRLARLGFDWVWFLSVWQTGPAGQRISRANPEWRKEFQATLPDLQEKDIAGSGFAIAGYTVHAQLGGDAALARLRERLHARGLRLMLDFVPNHTALDHPWVKDHPEYYIPGTEEDLVRAPHNYTRVAGQEGDLILAYGRDPYFPGWLDTFQLNYGNPAMQEAALGELVKVANQCEGLRCDMAMLLLPEIFQRTWGIQSRPFWPRAIRQIREYFPGFCFMAEVYWDLESTLQQQGFDYTYDKKLYDCLRAGSARAVREHFQTHATDQNKSAHFLENHDESRAAAVFAPGKHQAAAIVSFLCPGLRFFQQGQFEGWRTRISPHLGRRPNEASDYQLQRFYESLLGLLRQPIVRAGRWQLLECQPAWEGNWTRDCIVAFSWENLKEGRWLVAVNYATNQSQCYVRLPFGDLASNTWRLKDLTSDTIYDRNGDDLAARGLFLDVRPWYAAVFDISKYG
ncbi:MAG: alpha-amylase [Verrucomicrobia bacterium]|nr:alpha-amylase [Verrucomicrobiota bacterium]